MRSPRPPSDLQEGRWPDANVRANRSLQGSPHVHLINQEKAGPLGSPTPPWRAPLVGALFIPPGAFCAVYGYSVIQAIHWNQQSLKLGPIFLLSLLVALNAIVRWIGRRWAMTQGELAVIYGMWMVATAMGGIGMVQFHVTGLPVPFYSEFRDFHRLQPLIPDLLSPRDPEVARLFFQGNTTLYSAPILRAWLPVVLFWTGFLVLLAWVMLCLNALVRRAWMDGERLTYPLVQLPLEMVREGGASPFWKNRLMWGGFVVAGALESINSLNYLYPSIPPLPVKAIRYDTMLPGPPWNGMGMLALAFYPFAIGIAFLLTLDVSFSCWFFYLLTKAEVAMATAFGWREPGGLVVLARPPYIMEQGAGAFIGLALFALWTARRPLASAWRSALRGQRRRPEELISYRLAWSGALGGLLAATGLFAWLGLPFWLALAFFALYFLFQLTITRIVVEAGAGWHFAPAFNAHEFLFTAHGTGGIGPRGLTLLAYLSWIDLDYRDSPMPHQQEAMKLAQGTGTAMHRLFWPLLLAAAIGALAAYWANLHIYYENGAATAKVRPWLPTVGQSAFRQLRNWLANPRPPDFVSLQAVAGGFGVVSFLGLARQRLPWWPFHPVGYAVGNTQSMDYMWMPFFVGWLLKLVILHGGGMHLYRRALPFFLGLILGDYIVPALWFFFGWAQGIQMFMVFPH